MKEIIDFNIDQAKHVMLVQQLVWKFVEDLMAETIRHDQSKWSKEEYETFVASRDTLNKSKSGTDKEYQQQLKSDAILHHYDFNSHHPEYWRHKENSMPVHEVIIMFFDWSSRTIAKGGKLDDFWQYNIAKLKDCKQFHAIAIVEKMKCDYWHYIEQKDFE